jgi:hypothetical protein
MIRFFPFNNISAKKEAFSWPYKFDSRFLGSIEVENALILIVHAWCVDQFGEPGLRWDARESFFGFAEQADAAAFKIRWG